MNRNFSWETVCEQVYVDANQQRQLAETSGEEATRLNPGQRTSLVAISQRIPNNGIVIADEVGMGKTRIAVGLAKAVVKCGGRVAVLIPPGLGYQWQAELQAGGVNDVPNILRSIHGYLDVWSDESDDSDQRPWFKAPVVLISHAFANWRLSDAAAPWRWALVPELYAKWRTRSGHRLPRGYRDNEDLAKGWTCRNAAQSVVDSISNKRSPAGKMLDELGRVEWPRPADAKNYSKNGELRPWLERCVGIGLGRFDLVIIDEAHKSRKTGSGLSRLMNNIVMNDNQTRRVGLTATPVELGIEQWSETLARIGLNDEQLAKTQAASKRYANAVYRIRRTWRSSVEARKEFEDAAKQFESTLSPYLLRRDKREDLDVIQFTKYSGLPFHAYRREEEVVVDTNSLSPGWKAAICAAEALSVVTRQSDDPVAKRLRLTLGNGHGVSAILDQMQQDVQDDKVQKQSDQEEVEANSNAKKPTDKKRVERGKWWMKTMGAAFESEDRLLFNHPAILKAVETIESETGNNKKVLVFGRFTRPMRALVNLLNARELLRRLERKEPWPQSKVHGAKNGPDEDSEWPAVRAAHEQLSCSIPFDEINKRMERSYNQTQSIRQTFRESILDTIESGLQQLEPDEVEIHSLFREFKESVENPQQSGANSLAIVSRAIQSLHGSDQNLLDPASCARAFVELIAAASDKDNPDIDDDLDVAEISRRWEMILDRLENEYTRPEGGFARLMYGGTAQDSRRMIQLAFNRPNSFPRVLVAQSLVGREGLNLHNSCRTVVLLHPEWNPAMVEQQIGRVDRVNSLWCRELRVAIAENADLEKLPRIEIRGIVFSGTYDEMNWEVLKKRWDDLRAQLHGIVIPPSEMPEDEEGLRITSEIAKLTPVFSPPQAW